MVTISFCVPKGGTGKTTLAAITAAGLINRGFRVLLVDIDPQGNLTAQMANTPVKNNLADVLTARKSCNDVITETALQNCFILPATAELAGKDVLSGRGFEYALKNALKGVFARFDFCLIDCPPTIGKHVITAATAANLIISPLKADRFSIAAVSAVSEMASTIKAHTNADLKGVCALINQYNNRAIINQLAREQITTKCNELGVYLFKTAIRRSVSLEEAQFDIASFFENKKNPGVQDCAALVQEIINKVIQERGF